MPNAQEVLEWMAWKEREKKLMANMTNEEWFNGLSITEKAKWLSRHSQFMYNCGEKHAMPKTMYEEDWEFWLKEKHNE